MFVTLGPLKVLEPFAWRTPDRDDAAIRQVAVRAFVIASAGSILGSRCATIVQHGEPGVRRRQCPLLSGWAGGFLGGGRARVSVTGSHPPPSAL
jgi:hypothetical protein